ncbi:unnamed protein product [Gadus morhua 'NCC']
MMKQNADSGHGALTLSASSNPLKTFPLTSTPVKTFPSDQGLSTSCPDTPGTLDSSFSTVGEADENYQPNTTVTPTPFDCGAQRKEDGKKLHLSGDGRCDTPGFSAKNCHYTFMLDDTKEIIHTELLQKPAALLPWNHSVSKGA